MSARQFSWPVLACALAVSAAGCGYHVSGHASTIPKTIHTIAVPGFANATTRYQLARMLPEDVTRELLSRTHYQIVTDPNTADAVLKGALINYGAYGTTVAPSGQATGVQVIVNVQFSLTERATGKVLVQHNSYEIRERYQVSVNPETYFDESGTAMLRVSRDAARSIVSAILESF